MEAAIPRLSDSARPGIGIVTAVSTPASTSAGRPWASLPNTRASGPLRWRRSGRSPPWATAAMRIRPRSPSTPSTSCGSQPSTTGTWKSAPAEARTVFGLVTSTEPRQKITPWAPAASALRIRVPALPGSRTSTPTTRSLGSAPPLPLGPAPATSARAGGLRRATASTGWGVTVPATRSSTPGPRRWTRIPRRAARSSSAGHSDSASGAANSASMSACPSRAASRTFTPSTTNAPSDRRAERWARRRPIRRTRASRTPSPAPPPAPPLGSERLPGGGHKRAERVGIGDGQVGQHLAVEVDLGRPQAGHEAGVRHVVLPAGGVDPDDPQPAELALADPAVAVGVDTGVHDLLVGRLEAAAAVAAVALGRLEDGAAVLLPVDGALDPGHENLSLTAAEEPLDVLAVAAQDLGASAEAAGPLARLLLQQMGAEGLAAADLAGSGDLEALGRAPVGLHRGHWSPACGLCWVRERLRRGRSWYGFGRGLDRSGVGRGQRRGRGCRGRRPGTRPGPGAVAGRLARLRLLLLDRRQNHQHVAAVDAGRGLDVAHGFDLARDP